MESQRLNHAQIWLIGGTQESAELARAIAAQNWRCLVTVTTEAARCLYPESAFLTIWVGHLNESSLPEFLHAHAITAILDASHPFAIEVSQQAIAIAERLSIPYLRFERSQVKSEALIPNSSSSPSLLFFPTFQALLVTDLLIGQRVLLTVGYRPLAEFAPWQEKATLFARILPSETALQAALTAGFTPDRIIALRPPISAALERALWQQWQISIVVTKASGVAGGEAVKRQIAEEIPVRLVTIARPEMAYPQQTSVISVALQFCDRVLAVQ